MKKDTVGAMSCNPAIGGVGKGHLVREIDALDGVMGRVADASGIQFRVLNRRKGPAVHGPRTQSDRGLYKSALQNILADVSNLTLKEDHIEDLIQENGRITGVKSSKGCVYHAGAVVITTGTFLRGIIHIGEKTYAGGRRGDPPALALAQRLYDLGLKMGRLKTGTPPRLWRDSLDWESLPQQKADDNPVAFSFLTKAITLPQISCALTHTTEATHHLIGHNLQQSSVYSGAVTSRGPRYCPSIEDKVHRFPDRSRHQVFLEPEGLNSPLVYPMGFQHLCQKIYRKLS